MLQPLVLTCEDGPSTCGDRKIQLEIAQHKANELKEQAEVRLKQVELESKQKLDQVQQLQCKVESFTHVIFCMNLTSFGIQNLLLDNFPLFGTILQPTVSRRLIL